MSDAWGGAWGSASAWGVSWGTTARTPEGRRPKRRDVEKEILSDDEEVMAFLHASLPDLIDKFWKR